MHIALQQIQRALDIYARKNNSERDTYSVTNTDQEVRIEWFLSTIGGINLNGATIFRQAGDVVTVSREL